MQAGWCNRRSINAQQRLKSVNRAPHIHAPSLASRQGRRDGRRMAVVAAAKPNLYDVLGVPQTATDRDIKKAFRQKALKLHPDVNKAPDAEARFMEAKNAFAILSDAKERAEYDRRLRMGSGSWGDFSGWGSTSSGAASGARRPQQQQEEEFYGLGDMFRDAGSKAAEFADWARMQDVPAGLAGWVQEQGERLRTKGVADFFRDLDKELDDWTKSREKEGKPLNLWEELAGIGEELVDYLEGSLGIKEAEAAAKAKKDASSSSSNGSSSSASSSGSSKASSGSSTGFRTALDDFEDLMVNLGMDDKGSSSSSSNTSSSSSSSSSGSGNGRTDSSRSTAGQASSQQQQAPPKKKSSEEDIEDMLAALKKKHNK